MVFSNVSLGALCNKHVFISTRKAKPETYHTVMELSYIEYHTEILQNRKQQYCWIVIKNLTLVQRAINDISHILFFSPIEDNLFFDLSV